MSTTDHPRTNWAGNLTYRARELLRPAGVAELQEVVAAAAAAVTTTIANNKRD